MLRRIIFIAICLAPVALAVASMLAAPRPASTGAMMALGFAALIAAINLDLSFVRPWRYRRRHGSYDGLKRISGFPLVGTIGAVVAVWLAFGSKAIAAGSLLVLALDTGGSPWLLGVLWRESRSTDSPSPPAP